MLKKILIYNSGGGLGDAIQLFPLILSLKNHFKSGHFYYLGAHENHFLNKLKDILKKSIGKGEKTLLFATYNNQNVRRYLGIKLN